jgi:hypothetical protein
MFLKFFIMILVLIQVCSFDSWAMGEAPRPDIFLDTTLDVLPMGWINENKMLVLNAPQADQSGTTSFDHATLHILNTENQKLYQIDDTPLNLGGCLRPEGIFFTYFDDPSHEWPLFSAIRVSYDGKIHKGYKGAYNPDGQKKLNQYPSILRYPEECRHLPQPIENKLAELNHGEPSAWPWNWKAVETFHGLYLLHTPIPIKTWFHKPFYEHWPVQTITLDAEGRVINQTSIPLSTWGQSRGISDCFNECGLWPDIYYIEKLNIFIFVVNSRDYKSSPGLYVYNPQSQTHTRIFESLSINSLTLSPDSCTLAFYVGQSSYHAPGAQREGKPRMLFANLCSMLRKNKNR